MKESFVFSKENKKEYLFYLSVIPLFLYGIYKNGYILYTNDYIGINEIIKISLYPIIAVLLGFILGLIFKNKKNELLKFSVIAGLAIPFDFNMIAYFSITIGVLFLVTFVPNHLKINEAALLCVILISLNKIFNNAVLFNPMELTNMYKFSLVDLFFGRGASFLYTSSIFYLIIGYLFLIFIKTYKKNIFLISSSIYLLLFALYMIITKSYYNSFVLLLNGTTFFSFIYLAPINESSPSTQLEITIYSIVLGILSFILVFIFKVYTGAIISVFILSVLYRIYNNIRQKIFLKNI